MLKKFLITICGIFLLAGSFSVRAETTCVDPSETASGEAIFEYVAARLKISPLTEKEVSGFLIPEGSTRGRYSATFSDPENSEDCYGVFAVQDYATSENSLCRINSEITSPTSYDDLTLSLTSGSPYAKAGYVYTDADGEFQNVVSYLGRYQLGTLVACGDEEFDEFHVEAVRLAETAISNGVGAEVNFSDVADLEFSEAVKYLASQKIVAGYPDGTFGSERTINRAEFTKIVMGALNSENASTDGECFTDVAADAWFAPFVCAAKKNEIVAGYPDGTFGPAANVNVAEALKIVITAFRDSRPTNLPLANLQDSASLRLAPHAQRVATNLSTPNSPWYQPYVDAAKVSGIYLTNFAKLDQPLTRGEMAELVYRLLTATRSSRSPTFLVTSPAVDGGTYTTKTLPLKISGIVPANSTITVNGGYTLTSCCSATQTTWEYNLDPKYGNVAAGENDYEFVSKDLDGREVGRSTIKVIYEE